MSEAAQTARSPATRRWVPHRHGKLRLIALAGVTLLTAAWTSAAFWFQIAPPYLWLWLGVAAVIALAILITEKQRPGFGWGLWGVSLCALALWWSSILPSNDRDWAADVAHGVTATSDGSTVTLHDVRDFEWLSEESFTAHWETKRYALADLASVDLVSSVWDSPAIAHTLISFGFANGEHLVFSAEIRRKRGEAFSAVGGFFKEFELVLIAAEESDILRLRTNIRKETVSLFPLRLKRWQARALFLSYIDRANHLAREPEFYQTVSTNCTTVIFKLAQLVEPGIPRDWRILLSGYLPDYLYAHGLVRTDLPLAEVKAQALISPRAQAASSASYYSSIIRQGIGSLPLEADEQ